MRTDYEQRIRAAREKIEESNTKRIQLETKLDAANARRVEILEECKAKGIEPENLDVLINELKSKIETEINEIEDLLFGEEATEEPF